MHVHVSGTFFWPPRPYINRGEGNMSRFARTGQQLAHQASQMPDPAAARAAGSEKEPEALMDETIILSNSTSGAMALVFGMMMMREIMM